jgi:hypothetical protein
LVILSHMLLVPRNLFLSSQPTLTTSTVTLSHAMTMTFNILSWWHEHKQTFLILYILARDVLSVSISTVFSECCFSLTGRVIEEWRRCLAPGE